MLVGGVIRVRGPENRVPNEVPDPAEVTPDQRHSTARIWLYRAEFGLGDHYGTEGQRFESSRARLKTRWNRRASRLLAP